MSVFETLAPATGPLTVAMTSTSALIAGYSVEVTARDTKALEAARAYLRTGTEIYITFIPNERHSRVVEMAKRIRDAGFEPVPHIIARSFASDGQLEVHLRQLAQDARVDRVLVLAGDAEKPLGPFDDSAALLQTGLFQELGFRSVGLAWYPEGLNKARPEIVDAALLEKCSLLKSAGLRGWLVSQFCFEAEPIVRRARAIRQLGVDLPLRIGIAGPADRRRLMKYAIHCGIGNSIRVLGSATDRVKQLLTHETPDALLRRLAREIDKDHDLNVVGLHFFTFGGLAATAQWVNMLLNAESRHG